MRIDNKVIEALLLYGRSLAHGEKVRVELSSGPAIPHRPYVYSTTYAHIIRCSDNELLNETA